MGFTEGFCLIYFPHSFAPNFKFVIEVCWGGDE
jgi:hypothetical protein